MRTERELAGKVALVTGASSGIGQAVAIDLAGRGAAVAVNYCNNREGAEAVRRQIVEAGGRASVHQADVTQAAEVRRLTESVAAELGAVEVLVNNAGSLVKRMNLLEMTEECWDQAMALNLKSAFLCSQAVARPMIQRRSGVIINIASLAGRNGGALGAIHYAASKGGLIAFTKGLAKELAPHGIRVNAVNPGVIDTPFQTRFNTPETVQSFATATPLKRTGSAEEVAGVVGFLASPAASFLIGETIEVNGGMLML